MSASWQEDFRAWQEYAAANHARAERVRVAIQDRARAISPWGPEYAFHMAHNAMVGAHYGKPWRGVDYSTVRRILWLGRRAWIPYRLADAANTRAYRRLIDAHRLAS